MKRRELGLHYPVQRRQCVVFVPSQDLNFPRYMSSSFYFVELRWEVAFRFVNIGWIVDHHCKAFFSYWKISKCTYLLFLQSMQNINVGYIKFQMNQHYVLLPFTCTRDEYVTTIWKISKCTYLLFLQSMQNNLFWLN